MLFFLCNLNHKCICLLELFRPSRLEQLLFNPAWWPRSCSKQCTDVHTSIRTPSISPRTVRTGADPHKHQPEVRRLRKIKQESSKKLNHRKGNNLGCHRVRNNSFSRYQSILFNPAWWPRSCFKQCTDVQTSSRSSRTLWHEVLKAIGCRKRNFNSLAVY